MARKFASKAEREFNQLVDSVFVRWDNPKKTRKTVERKLLEDYHNEDRMAIWRLAAQSRKWRIE